MYETDALHKRGQALENEFFHRVDEQLLANLREDVQREKNRELLASATGFHDEQLLKHLVDEQFEVSTITALALVPVVWVAWADGQITPYERQTIMRVALRRGLDQEPMAFHLIEEWMMHRPPTSLWTLWKEYATAVKQSLPEDTARSLSGLILDQAVAVATAAGNESSKDKISEVEQSVLDEIAAVLA